MEQRADANAAAIRTARLATVRLRATLMRNSHRAYHSRRNLRFMASLEHTLIADAIFDAEQEGKPFTETSLAKHLNMVRKTLHTQLYHKKYGLVPTGLVILKGRHLCISPETLVAPEALHNIRHHVAAILAAAAIVEKLVL